MRTFLLALMLLLATPYRVWGQQVALYGHFPLALGQGWDPLEPDVSRTVGGCFVSPRNTPEAAAANVDAYTAWDDEESTFFRSTGLRVSAGGAFVAGSVGIGYQTATVLETSERSLTWALVVRKEFPGVQVEAVELTSKGARLRDLLYNGKADPEAVFTECGRVVVTGLTRETKLSIVYTATFSSSSRMEAARGELKATYKGMSGSVDYEDIVRQHDTRAIVDIQIYLDGVASDDTSLARLIRQNPTDIQAIRNSAADVLEAMSGEGIVRSASLVPAVDIFADPQIDALAVDDRLDIVWDLSARLLEVEAYLTEVRELRDDLQRVLALEQDGRFTLEGDQRDALVAGVTAANQKLERLVDLRNGCRAAAHLAACEPLAERPSLDPAIRAIRPTSFLPEDWLKFVGWRDRQHWINYVAQGEYFRTRLEVWPLFDIMDIHFVKEITFRNQSDRVVRLKRRDLSASGEGITSRGAFYLLSRDVSSQFLNGPDPWRSHCWGGNPNACAGLARAKRDAFLDEDDQLDQAVVATVRTTDGTSVEIVLPRPSTSNSVSLGLGTWEPQVASAECNFCGPAERR